MCPSPGIDACADFGRRSGALNAILNSRIIGKPRLFDPLHLLQRDMVLHRTLLVLLLVLLSIAALIGFAQSQRVRYHKQRKHYTGYKPRCADTLVHTSPYEHRLDWFDGLPPRSWRTLDPRHSLRKLLQLIYISAALRATNPISTLIAAGPPRAHGVRARHHIAYSTSIVLIAAFHFFQNIFQILQPCERLMFCCKQYFQCIFVLIILASALQLGHG